MHSARSRASAYGRVTSSGTLRSARLARVLAHMSRRSHALGVEEMR